jgi:hypothetical protein
MKLSMPDRCGLLIRTAIAAAVGAFVVFCAVLPAECRKDPPGFGRLTGLLDLSAPCITKQDAPVAAPAAPLNQNFWFFPTAYKTDTIRIPIGGDGEVEYKIKRKAGQAVVYRWQRDSGNVYNDFHGEPLNNPRTSQTYKKEEELKSATELSSHPSMASTAGIGSISQPSRSRSP